MHVMMRRLTNMVESIRQHKVVSTVEMSQAEDDIAQHLCETWELCDVWPENQRLVRHVRTALAALGGPPQVVEKHAIRIAWKVRIIHEAGRCGRNSS